jgi:hypothetical protein
MNQPIPVLSTTNGETIIIIIVVMVPFIVVSVEIRAILTPYIEFLINIVEFLVVRITPTTK